MGVINQRTIFHELKFFIITLLLKSLLKVHVSSRAELLSEDLVKTIMLIKINLLLYETVDGLN